MRDYELLLIIHPDVAEDDIPGTLDKVAEHVTAKGGTVGETASWGKKKLAYPIGHSKDGTYFLTQLKLEPGSIVELEANLRLSESILRHMLVRLDEK